MIMAAIITVGVLLFNFAKDVFFPLLSQRRIRETNMIPTTSGLDTFF